MRPPCIRHWNSWPPIRLYATGWVRQGKRTFTAISRYNRWCDRLSTCMIRSPGASCAPGPRLGRFERIMEIRTYLNSILRYWWLVLLLLVAGGVGAALLDRTKTPTYSTEARIAVRPSPA